ncbi:DUF1902 domain-containing protein [Xenorhabdus sp. Flor]|uniref:DUF1902 domain-containing protein n=1 Tax=Xenorhabdus cabanillasii TaxID=351673 RepID=UPI0019BF43E1|nr:DUF1902 domain-containing protein [Xenorhabdus sp. Flor]MBD2816742.1 DUF1902 domain-containing protein [Xenorhabdus sp. Flor]
MKLRCMAYRQGDIYIAACLDLSLAAQADSIDDAISKLESQVDDYLEEINSEPKYAEQLLNRKAPLSIWLRYYLYRSVFFILKIIGRLRQHTDSFRLFDEQRKPA